MQNGEKIQRHVGSIMFDDKHVAVVQAHKTPPS